MLMKPVSHRSASSGAISSRVAYTDDYPTVTRCIAFADMSSYTQFTDPYGAHAAAQMVSDFRSIIRTSTGRHGIRVASWIGDGSMLVGLQTTPVIEALQDIATQCKENGIPIHCGLATGDVIIFEGNDYIGGIVNIAFRLAHLAGDSELCTYSIGKAEIPKDLQWDTLRNTSVKGVDSIDEVFRIKLV